MWKNRSDIKNVFSKKNRWILKKFCLVRCLHFLCWKFYQHKLNMYIRMKNDFQTIVRSNFLNFLKLWLINGFVLQKKKWKKIQLIKSSLVMKLIFCDKSLVYSTNKLLKTNYLVTNLKLILNYYFLSKTYMKNK